MEGKEEPPVEPDTHETDCKQGEEETYCGFGGWAPGWLQPLSSKKVFLLVFGLMGAMQSAVGAYFVATITTLEKRFRLPSTYTGVIGSGWEAGNLCGAVVVAYLGSRGGHKTRWVAVGALLAGATSFFRCLPHAVFGPARDLPSEYQGEGLCEAGGGGEERCRLDGDGAATFALMLAAHFLVGLGTSTYETLGIAYMDDNTRKNKFPLLLAIAQCIRLIGPSFGFLLASFSLQYYNQPTVVPSFSREDPRWIGAWWIGWIPIGTLQMFFGSLMLFFPRTLPREAERRRAASTATAPQPPDKSFKDFKATVRRLARNPVLVLNSFSSTFYVFGMMGYYTFFPKYLETMFRLSASEANLITGSVGLVCTGLGVAASGAVISRFRPRPSYLAGWNVVTEALEVLGHLSFAFLGCPKEDLHGGFDVSGRWSLSADCNSRCECSPSLDYSPVCALGGSPTSTALLTFYSPCHAGCTSSSTVRGTTVYQNCSCTAGSTEATDGACAVDCSHQLLLFLIVFCCLQFLSATGRAGNTIIQFRSVSAEDKAVSIALSEVLLSALAFTPAPIFFGALLDYSCLVWERSCGVTGNCWLYDGLSLRRRLNYTTSGFLFLATLLDVGVLCSVGGLRIYDEDFASPRPSKEEGLSPSEQAETTSS